MENAGLPLRFVAVLIDAGVFFVGAFVLALFTGGTYAESADGGGTAGFELGGGGFFLWMLLALGYYVVLEGAWGATIGKRAVGIRVVSEDGEPIGLGASFVRNILRLVDGLFFYIVGALVAASSPRGQRLGDRAAHTVVVRG
jgi:uncharacterized RDD family membrane protein YckC